MSWKTIVEHRSSSQIVIYIRFWFLPQLAVLLLVSMQSALVADNESQSAGARMFATKIRPLLTEKCLACHGAKPNDIKSSFDLRTRETALRGGESGDPAIVPGKPEESTLYKAVRWDGLEMPPKKNDRLTKEQVELIRQWIAAGAPWA